MYLQPVQDLTVADRVSRTLYQYTLEAPDPQDLERWVPQFVKELQSFPQLQDIATDQENRGLQAKLVIDRRTASRFGITPQLIDGLTSTSEWTGVPLATLFREVGVKPGAKWLLAEGADAAVMARSIPMDKAAEDALIAYGQNGEALRPEQGYPARLLLPGWEGNANVKWIRRIEIADRPFMTREETSKYTDPLPDGTARMYSFAMDAKSIITFPAYPVILPERGWYEISGLAWSGRSRIRRVDVSTDAGNSGSPPTCSNPCSPSATPGSAACGGGMAGKPRCSAARPTRPATCSPPWSSYGAPVGSARRITSITSARGGYGATGPSCSDWRDKRARGGRASRSRAGSSGVREPRSGSGAARCSGAVRFWPGRHG